MAQVACRSVRQSLVLKILVSVVRFRPGPPSFPSKRPLPEVGVVVSGVPSPFHALGRTFSDAANPIAILNEATNECAQPRARRVIVTRKYIDCREFPSEKNCSVAISADSEDELLQAAVDHAVSVHGHTDTPELRMQLRQLFKDGVPPENPPVPGQSTTAETPAVRH